MTDKNKKYENDYEEEDDLESYTEYEDDKQIHQIPQITLSVGVVYKNNKPAIILRRLITDANLIQSIVRHAYHNQPIVAHPCFRDKLQAINNLTQKGIIYFKDGQYYFTF